MAETPDTDPIVEILRKLQASAADHRDATRLLNDNVTGIRNQLHSMQGDSLRQEHLIAALRVDIDRIKTRLDLSDHADA